MFSVQDAASELLAAFDLDFGDTGMTVRLSEDAPDLAADLAEKVFGGRGPDELVRLFEALSVISEADDPRTAEVDEKVCPEPAYRVLLAELEGLIGG
ncbi:hypothetical protein [Desulfovibrio sp. X2]|uniref:hypothetical protein n=1 Tax=Desulfovibrio sp. X2 TaxID=941449 RepID=UPI000419B732|nr:hypothetical protein [Desulfovibrio sp. X2]